MKPFYRQRPWDRSADMINGYCRQANFPGDLSKISAPVTQLRSGQARILTRHNLYTGFVSEGIANAAIIDLRPVII